MRWNSIILHFHLLFTTSYVTAEKVLRTKVAILGAGMSGVTAAKTLHGDGVHDFVIVEARSELGGRMQTHTLVNGINVELGPNWIHGLGHLPSRLNPIYSLAIKHNLTTTSSNDHDLISFDRFGQVDLNKDLQEVAVAWEKYLALAGTRLDTEEVDLTARAGFRLAAFKPENHFQEIAEYFLFDFTFAQPPEVTSFIGAANNHNHTINQYSESANFVIDQRGFKFLIQQEANSFLNSSDSRLFLNHTVTNITYSTKGVQIQTKQGITIQADHAICTFSLGVLQNDDVIFYPSLPLWKQEAIYGTNMATYTKIFLRFNQSFWAQHEFWLYADHKRRGYYPVWQSLDMPKFLPNSNLLLVTVTDVEALRVSKQSKEETQAEIMEVLRSIYGDHIPNPEEIVYKNWHSDPLFRGSYSNWGASYPFDIFRRLREPLYGRLWFAGEGTSTAFFGFLHGAYLEGQKAATAIAKLIDNPDNHPDRDPSSGYRRISEYSNGFLELRGDSINEVHQLAAAATGAQLVHNFGP